MIRLVACAALAASPLAAQREPVAVTIPGKAYPDGRQAWIHKPAGYPGSCMGGCNLIIAFDGVMYLGAMPLAGILDSLTAAKRIPPTVAVLFDNGVPPERILDLANSSGFADFIARELLPWVRARYAVTHSPGRTILAGASAGGLGAAYVAFRYPSLFGNVLSQSGAFWRGNEATVAPPHEWLTGEYASSPRLNIRFFLDVGTRETARAADGDAPSLLDANRRLADVLRKRGYRVEYHEVPDGSHSTDTWRKRLPLGIVALSDTTK